MSRAVVRRRSRAVAKQRNRGFTLIEILVTFAVVAILLGLAAPSFVTFQRNSDLTATANAFVAALSAARAEAMKRQRNAYVVPATDAGWVSGWTVFVDANSDQALSGGDVTVFKHEAVPSTVTVVTSSAAPGFVNGSSTYVMFSGSGFTRLNDGSFKSDAIDFTNGTETRRVIVNPAGRLRVCKPVTDAGCTFDSL